MSVSDLIERLIFEDKRFSLSSLKEKNKEQFCSESL